MSFGLPRKKTLPPFLNPGFEVVSFHFFFSQLDKELFRFLDKPLIGTSANVSGQPDVSSAEKVMEYFSPTFGTSFEPELILDGGRLAKKNPSAIIELSGSEVKVIRGGDYEPAELQKDMEEFIAGISRKNGSICNKKL
jgi:L-threonylcarbamoyladenylate synthase